MRTTLSIDDDVLMAAKEIAAAESTSVGAALSVLARRGLTPGSRITTDDGGMPVVRVSPGIREIRVEDVAAALDDW